MRRSSAIRRGSSATKRPATGERQEGAASPRPRIGGQARSCYRAAIRISTSPRLLRSLLVLGSSTSVVSCRSRALINIERCHCRRRVAADVNGDFLLVHLGRRMTLIYQDRSVSNLWNVSYPQDSGRHELPLSGSPRSEACGSRSARCRVECRCGGTMSFLWSLIWFPRRPRPSACGTVARARSAVATKLSDAVLPMRFGTLKAGFALTTDRVRDRRSLPLPSATAMLSTHPACARDQP